MKHNTEAEAMNMNDEREERISRAMYIHGMSRKQAVTLINRELVYYNVLGNRV